MPCPAVSAHAARNPLTRWGGADRAVRCTAGPSSRGSKTNAYCTPERISQLFRESCRLVPRQAIPASENNRLRGVPANKRETMTSHASGQPSGNTYLKESRGPAKTCPFTQKVDLKIQLKRFTSPALSTQQMEAIHNANAGEQDRTEIAKPGASRYAPGFLQLMSGGAVQAAFIASSSVLRMCSPGPREIGVQLGSSAIASQPSGTTTAAVSPVAVSSHDMDTVPYGVS